MEIILLIATMAIMSGYHHYRAMADFVTKNKKELVRELKLKKRRLPSRDTIRRALESTDFDELSELFRLWAKEQVPIEKRDVISMDGKAIGGTFEGLGGSKQRFINLVSAFSAGKKQVLAVKKIENNKESEIPAIRELVRMLNLEGVVFTADALHCQKETARIIAEGGNDYVLGAKGNQKSLYAQIKKTPKANHPIRT